VHTALRWIMDAQICARSLHARSCARCSPRAKPSHRHRPDRRGMFEVLRERGCVNPALTACPVDPLAAPLSTNTRCARILTDEPRTAGSSRQSRFPSFPTPLALSSNPSLPSSGVGGRSGSSAEPSPGRSRSSPSRAAAISVDAAAAGLDQLSSPDRRSSPGRAADPSVGAAAPAVAPVLE
jgi:hypothetical protein